MRPRLPGYDHPMHLVAGQAVWLAWFGVVYGGMSVACAAWPQAAAAGPLNLINLALLVLTLLVTALLAGTGWAAWRAAAHASPGRPRFVVRASAVLYASAALATLLVGAPLLVVPPCL